MSFSEKDTSDVCGAAENQNTNEIEELQSYNATCEFRNHSLDKPGRKGKGSRRVQKRKVAGEKEAKTGDTEHQDSLAKTNFTSSLKSQSVPEII